MGNEVDHHCITYVCHLHTYYYYNSNLYHNTMKLLASSNKATSFLHLITDSCHMTQSINHSLCMCLLPRLEQLKSPGLFNFFKSFKLPQIIQRIIFTNIWPRPTCHHTPTKKIDHQLTRGVRYSRVETII